MKKSSEYALIAFIFLFVLAVRLYFAYAFPFFESDGSYFHYRQIMSIKETGFPIFQDTLSYSGRTFSFSPVFHYVFALFSYFFSLKFVENFFASSLVIFIYFLVKFLTNNPVASIFASFASGFIPVFFNSTVNSLNPISFFSPFFILLIYAFFNIHSKNWVVFYVIFFMFLSFTHPLIMIFVLGLIFYLIFLVISKLPFSKAEIEVSLFSLFFALWAQFLLYKKVFLTHGFAFVWQNIPEQFLSRFFSQVTIFAVFINIGIFVFFFGLYILFNHVFSQKNKHFLFIVSLVFGLSILLMLRLIALQTGLSLLGVLFVLLFADWVSHFYSYIKLTKFASFQNMFSALIFVFLLFFSFFPSVLSISNFNSKSVFEALFWLNTHSDPESVVLGNVDEGHMISAIAKRKNVVDSFFLLQKDVEKRLEDIDSFFTTLLSTEAIALAQKYDISYIILSDKSKKQYGISTLQYADGGCFSEVFKNNEVVVYEKKHSCKIRVIQ